MWAVDCSLVYRAHPYTFRPHDNHQVNHRFYRWGLWDLTGQIICPGPPSKHRQRWSLDWVLSWDWVEQGPSGNSSATSLGRKLEHDRVSPVLLLWLLHVVTWVTTLRSKQLWGFPNNTSPDKLSQPRRMSFVAKTAGSYILHKFFISLLSIMKKTQRTGSFQNELW